MFMRLFWFSILLLSTTVAAITIHYVHIDPSQGEDNPSCHSSNSTNISCRTLNWALRSPSRLNGTHYMLSEGVHYLSGPVPTFERLSDMSFIGHSTKGTIMQCTSNDSGLAYQGVVRVALVNMTVSNCSSLRYSTSKNFYAFAESGMYEAYMFPVALYFISCTNVTLDGLRVESTPHGTGVVMYDTFGSNSVLNSCFYNNTGTTSPYPGGGGLYIEFTYCIPGDNDCYKNQATVKSYYSNNTLSTYTIHNCTFSQNKANASDSGTSNATYIVPYRADHMAFGRGGGLSIFVKGNASTNTFNISNCTFESNAAIWGGGIFVEFHDDTFDNQVIVSNSVIRNNICYFETESGTAGGGMRIGHYVYGIEPISGHGNHITIVNCSFENNAALDGGGLSISPTVENVQPSQVATVDIIGTNFTGNFGKLGAALYIDRFVMILEGYVLNVNVQDCVFHNNSVDYTNYIQTHFKAMHNAFQKGVGAVYVNQVPVAFTSHAHFSWNYGSALAAVSTGISFANCSATFSHNKGDNGGAIALLGAAYLMVSQQTSLTFKDNKATLLGGAIYNTYIERENLISYTNCFIRHKDPFLRPDEWTSNFVFHNNMEIANNRHSAIHTTSILPCSRAGGSGISKNTSTIFCWNALHWDYRPTSCSHQIFSSVGEISFQIHNESMCGDNLEVKAFPGHQFTLPITIRDDLHNPIGNETVFSALNNASGRVNYIWDKNMTINGQENICVPLKLDTVGDRIWEVSIDIDLQPCPPGFKNNGDQCVCADHYIRALDCDIERFEAYISENNWIGKVPENDTYYFVSFCPRGFCSAVKTALPNNLNETEEKICGRNNRKGVLCGMCKDGYGVSVTSPHNCVKCNDIGASIAKYIASVYIPLVALFAAIILFNIRLTSGPANAFILYSQVIAGTFELNADGQIAMSDITRNVTARLDDAYRTIYGVFNLKFVESFIQSLCLGNLNTLDTLLVEYVVAFSPLIMIIIVLVIFRLKGYCSCCRRRRRYQIRTTPKRSISSAIIPAFAAFLLLSYTKFTTVSAYILLAQPLFDEYGNPAAGPYHVYYAGQFKTDSPEYTKYKVIAYVINCTFVAIPPLLLLDFPRRIFERVISKSAFLWQHYPADKVQILLDAFQGCYKNKMRFFAGLYFVFRLVINVSYSFTHNWFDQYLAQQVTCAIMVVLLAICQPYRDSYKLFNIVDILIFTNLAIINALSSYLLSQSSSSSFNVPHSVPVFPIAVQYILLFLPLVFMISYLVWICISPYSNRIKQRVLKLLLSILQKFGAESQHRSLQMFISNNATEPTVSNNVHEDTLDGIADEEEALLQRAQTRNLYRPVTRTVVGLDD